MESHNAPFRAPKGSSYLCNENDKPYLPILTQLLDDQGTDKQQVLHEFQKITRITLLPVPFPLIRFIDPLI